MECAINARVPIHILNTFKIDSPGTVVDPSLAHGQSSNGPVTAVVSKKGISVLNVASNRKLGSTTYIARVFDTFARHGVKIDLISTSETNLSITLHESTPELKVRRRVWIGESGIF
jgi:aspartate kinase